MTSRMPTLANLVISNVPGAPVPLYLAGAEFLSFHPLSIITHGLGLNITIQTYAGRVDFGIIADKKALPHATDLAEAIDAAFTEAQALLMPLQAPEKPPKQPAKKPSKQTVIKKQAVKQIVAKVTRTSASDKSPALKTRLQRDSSSKPHKIPTSNASNHGKIPVKKTPRSKPAK